MIRFDAGDLAALGVELPRMGVKATSAMVDVFVESGKQLEATWRANATETAGRHGKHYPKSITTDLLLATNIVVEVGPDPNLPQGGMSFEYGSRNQPPHLDGQRAADAEIPKIDKRIDSALGFLGL